MQEKRQINSEAELVNALCKDIKVDKYSIDGVFRETITFDNVMEDANFIFSILYEFRYSEPVEVVEIPMINFNDGLVYSQHHPKPTHKQNQIHQNGQIIWTETVEV